MDLAQRGRLVDATPDHAPIVTCLDEHTVLPPSPLGVWSLQGNGFTLDLLALLLKAMESSDTISASINNGEYTGGATETTNRGRINTNFPFLALNENRLQNSVLGDIHDAASVLALNASRALEEYIGVPPGTLAKAHDQFLHSIVRFVSFESGTETPPHMDSCGFTLLFNTAPLEIQSKSGDFWWKIPRYALLSSPGGEEWSAYLLIGSHLNYIVDSLPAPVHQVSRQRDSSRYAVTIFINADVSWSALAKVTNAKPKGKVPTTKENALADFAWDSELFSKSLIDNGLVPATDRVVDHWKLLTALVEGTIGESGFDRPPDVGYRGYWQLQTRRYLAFLRLHVLYGEEAGAILPPREIHHVWLCHQLQPVAYRTDCLRLLGRVVAHSNGAFNMSGCPKFHELWFRLTGTTWSHREILIDERRHAARLQVSMDVSVFMANLWFGYDALAAIYDGVCDEFPSALSGPLDEPLQKARADYSRFLVASSYAATKGEKISPMTAFVDLIWHAHQSDTNAYDQTMDQLPIFLDHDPCGELHPPPRMWLESTNAVWDELYKTDAFLSGQAIYCSCGGVIETPHPRPGGIHHIGHNPSELAWWFPHKGPFLPSCLLGGLELGLDSFSPEAAASALDPDMSGGQRAAVLSTFRLMKEELNILDSRDKREKWLCLLCLPTLGIVHLCCHNERRPCRKKQYEDVVSRYNSELEALGYFVWISWNVVASKELSPPLPDSSHIYSASAYRGPALVFRHCNPRNPENPQEPED